MLNQFYLDFSNSISSDLKQYCEMENVLPEALVYSRKSKPSIKLNLEAAAFHLLQRIAKRLDKIIGRLSADMDHNSRLRRPVS